VTCGKFTEKRRETMRKEDWEERLKALLSKFREDNMSDYRKSEEYQNDQEKMNEASRGIEMLNLNEKTMKAINNMSDIENDTGTAYMEQAYIQGICDGIRLVKFFQQN